MIPQSIVDRAWNTFVSGVSETGLPIASMRKALEAVEGNFEQKFANDQVQDGRRTGRCPVCGGDMD